MYKVRIDGNVTKYSSYDEAKRQAVLASEHLGSRHDVIDDKGVVVAQFVRGRRYYDHGFCKHSM